MFTHGDILYHGYRAYGSLFKLIFIFFIFLVIFIYLIIKYPFLYYSFEINNIKIKLYYIYIFFLLLFIIIIEWKHYYYLYIITTEEIYIKKGIIANYTNTYNYTAIQEIKIDQNAIKRILLYGRIEITLLILFAGESKIETANINYIHRPRLIEKLLMENKIKKT